jgi:hypothetical protein
LTRIKVLDEKQFAKYPLPESMRSKALSFTCPNGGKYIQGSYHASNDEMKDEILGILFDMETRSIISTDNVYTNIKEEP